MNEPVELSLEQKFELSKFQSQVNKMNLEQAQDMLVKLFEQRLVEKEIYKQIIAKEWNIGAK